jgi:hypothetical protein
MLLTPLMGVENLYRLRPIVIHHDVSVSVLASVKLSSTLSEWAAILPRRHISQILASRCETMHGHRAVLVLVLVINAGLMEWLHSITRMSQVFFLQIGASEMRSDRNLAPSFRWHEFI